MTLMSWRCSTVHPFSLGHSEGRTPVFRPSKSFIAFAHSLPGLLFSFPVLPCDLNRASSLPLKSASEVICNLLPILGIPCSATRERCSPVAQSVWPSQAVPRTKSPYSVGLRRAAYACQKRRQVQGTLPSQHSKGCAEFYHRPKPWIFFPWRHGSLHQRHQRRYTSFRLDRAALHQFFALGVVKQPL